MLDTLKGTMDMGRWLVVAMYLVGCFASSAYIDFCFPALFAELFNVVSTHAAFRWSIVFPAARDVIWFLLFAIAGLMTLWSFLQAVVVDPGRVPIAFSNASPKAASLALRLASGIHPCGPCVAYKPTRTHHCSRCKRCVLKYDHHCPWIGQCVGFFNYKLYLLFLWYLHVFTQVITTSISGAVFRRVLGLLGAAPQAGSDSIVGAILRFLSLLPIGSTASAVYDANLAIIATYALAFPFQILTLYLIAKHTRLSRHNRCTIDVVIWEHMPQEEQEHWVNPYDLGVDENLEMVFGDGQWSADARHGKKTAEEVRASDTFRWLRRLLPISAYPAQNEAMLLNLEAFQQTPKPTYGSVDGGHTSPRRNCYRLLEDDRYLGLVHPVATQVREHA